MAIVEVLKGLLASLPARRKTFIVKFRISLMTDGVRTYPLPCLNFVVTIIEKRRRFQINRHKFTYRPFCINFAKNVYIPVQTSQ